MTFKRDIFRRQFDREAFTAFRTTYEGINPDRPVETLALSFDETAEHLKQRVGTDAESLEFTNEFLPALGTLLQGPFPLPGNRIAPSAWDCRGKMFAYEACGLTPKTVRGKRCLDVGSNAGYDVFLLASMGALEVVGTEPNGFFHHAQFFSAVYDFPGVSFLNLGWEDLDRRYLYDFDLVTCLGLIYHVKEPGLLIDRLASIMRPGATLVMETHVLSETSHQNLYIEDKFWGDETYWWVFGDECLKGMLRTAGFSNVQMLLKMDCDSRNPLDPTTTVEGYPAGARAWFAAQKS